MHAEGRRLPETEPADSPWLGLARAAAVGHIVPGAAHELSNSLTTILGHLHVLVGRTDLSEALRDRLELLASEGARAAGLLRAIMTVSRGVSAGRRPCSLVDHAQRVLDLMRGELHRDGVRVVTEFEECPVVRADEWDLEHAILALVQRARHAMRAGSEEAVLIVRSGRTPHGARLEILDTGVVDDRELPPRLADALALGPISAGLALARHIAASEGGR